jgi:hypothetical protein
VEEVSRVLHSAQSLVVFVQFADMTEMLLFYYHNAAALFCCLLISIVDFHSIQIVCRVPRKERRIQSSQSAGHMRHTR